MSYGLNEQGKYLYLFHLERIFVVNFQDYYISFSSTFLRVFIPFSSTFQASVLHSKSLKDFPWSVEIPNVRSISVTTSLPGRQWWWRWREQPGRHQHESRCCSSQPLELHHCSMPCWTPTVNLTDVKTLSLLACMQRCAAVPMKTREFSPMSPAVNAMSRLLPTWTEMTSRLSIHLHTWFVSTSFTPHICPYVYWHTLITIFCISHLLLPTTPVPRVPRCSWAYYSFTAQVTHAVVTTMIRLRFDFNSTSISRSFDCLWWKVNKFTVT